MKMRCWCGENDALLLGWVLLVAGSLQPNMYLCGSLFWSRVNKACMGKVGGSPRKIIVFSHYVWRVRYIFINMYALIPSYSYTYTYGNT